ncbi:DNA-binding response regulator [Gluconacetobacter entanii]|uniref:DNA-binding response regulator n=2 Tax=Gluconacetobacter entanii TaxID=108528 RepID=A0A318PNF7_9PROT|nr:DNA-binding response regulator [Gluconacetobacter entanii]
MNANAAVRSFRLITGRSGHDFPDSQGTDGAPVGKGQNFVLVVEDDMDIRNLLTRFLSQQGYEVASAMTAAEVLAILARRTPDIVLLDLMLPQESGHAICRLIRKRSAIPIIMVTALADVRERIAGLDLGADDYISKPFDLGELAARIRAVLRRPSSPPAYPTSGLQPGCRFGNWIFMPEKRALYSTEGVRMTLTGAETDLLLLLWNHAGELLSRQRIIELLYNAPGAVEERTIDLLVSRLRRKLAHGGRQLEMLRTVRGDGYVFDPGPAVPHEGAAD